MIFGSDRTQDKYEAKGYSIYRCYSNAGRDEAEQKARELREKGYYAVAMEHSTNIPGYHDFSVWWKSKTN